MQSAIRKQVLEVAPIGTKLNASDLNTKKLSATRKRFLLYFLGATKFDEESGQQESVGETEFVERMTEEAFESTDPKDQQVDSEQSKQKYFAGGYGIECFRHEGLHGQRRTATS